MLGAVALLNVTAVGHEVHVQVPVCPLGAAIAFRVTVDAVPTQKSAGSGPAFTVQGIALQLSVTFTAEVAVQPAALVTVTV